MTTCGPGRPAGRARCLPAVLGLLLAGTAVRPAGAATVTGAVRDPQDAVVPGASVTVRCPGSTIEGRTDGQGRFRLETAAARAPAGCLVSARAAGFASSDEQPVAGAADLVLRLPRPVVSETLTVQPQDEAGLSAHRSLASASLDPAELRAVSDDPGELVRYARARAGVPRSTAGQVYVDGLPAGVLPPAEVIGRITVDGDPFSAEYGDGSDGGHVEITTAVPERRLRLNVDGSGFGLGGGSGLDSSARSASRSWAAGVSVPVPALPITFALHASLVDQRQDVPIRAAAPQGAAPLPATAVATTTSGSVLAAVDYASGGTRARVSVLGVHGEQSAAGVSGITLPEAGMRVGSDSRELRASLTSRTGSLVQRAGLVGSRSQNRIVASSLAPGVSVAGAWNAGGADATAALLRSDGWTGRYVVESPGARRPWRAGAWASWDADSESDLANPGGRLVFATPQAFAAAEAGGATGTWFGARGASRARYATVTVSPFVETDLLRSPRAELRAGLRGDYQKGGGLLLSPRLAAVYRCHGLFDLRAGAGTFVHDWPTGVLLQALENDLSHRGRVLLTGASLLDPADGGVEGRAVPIDSRLAGDLTRPRDLVLRSSIERSRGDLRPGLEYTWVRSDHRLGSRRLAAGDGWVDTLESNRWGRRQQLHLSLQWQAKGQRVGGHYHWTRARDDTAGPFSFPASQADLDGEAARSAGIAAHELTVVGSFRLPAGVSLTVVESYRSSVPYDLTTGTDPFGIGLYTFRGGRRRNSGDGPDYHSTSLHCSRRVPLPLPRGRAGQRLHAKLVVQVENLFDRRNDLSLGSVAGSPLFGLPLVALPGRSVRLSLGFDR